MRSRTRNLELYPNRPTLKSPRTYTDQLYRWLDLCQFTDKAREILSVCKIEVVLLRPFSYWK